jgi:hypothetical protein
MVVDHSGENQCLDMAFQWRGLMFWLTGPDEATLPGVDAEAERRMLEEIIPSMGRSSVCIGFPHSTRLDRSLPPRRRSPSG